MNTKEFNVAEMPEWVCGILFESNQISDREYIKDNKPKNVIPIDRCHAICKHLFELMPNSNLIQLDNNGMAYIQIQTNQTIWVKLSINPFKYTDITEMAKEPI